MKPIPFKGLLLAVLVGVFVGLTENNLPAQVDQAPPQNKPYEFSFYYIKYSGGGDWYEGKVGAKNLMQFINSHKGVLKCNETPAHLSLGDSILFEQPFLYITGHGNITFDANEKRRLKRFLLEGGFLYANDDYGMHKSFVREMKSIFPDKKWAEVPNKHPLFGMFYEFSKGSPKIHKHDGGPPQTLALFHEGKIIVLYTKNTDIGDGWAPYQVHKNPEELRKAALQFGMNIILFALSQ